MKRYWKSLVFWALVNLVLFDLTEQPYLQQSSLVLNQEHFQPGARGKTIEQNKSSFYVESQMELETSSWSWIRLGTHLLMGPDVSTGTLLSLAVACWIPSHMFYYEHLVVRDFHVDPRSGLAHLFECPSMARAERGGGVKSAMLLPLQFSLEKLQVKRWPLSVTPTQPLPLPYPTWRHKARHPLCTPLQFSSLSLSTGVQNADAVEILKEMIYN